MPNQYERRFKKRVPCRLRQGGRSFTGVVLDLSRGGLFVQTSAAVQPGEQVEITLSRTPSTRGPDQTAQVDVTAQVAWKRRVPSQLRSVAQGGLGLQIRYATEPYFTLLAEAARGTEI
jgi:Tfp pilus assembly protein PilZ